MNRKTFAAFWLLQILVLLRFAARAQSNVSKPNPTCCSTVSRALDAASQLRSGMKRSEVEKAFTVDGGISFRDQTVYVFKECRIIKISIKFTSANPGPENDPDDEVVSVSQPFLDYEVKD